MNEVASDGTARTGAKPPENMVHTQFTAQGDGHRIPAIAWLPTFPSGAPVVLLAHGGSGHKGIDRHHVLARQLARHGVASVAIDGPYHGDRAVEGDGRLDYQQRVVDEGPDLVHARMCQDWLYALDTASHTWGLDRDTVGYFGLSMGARYGIAVCAELGAQLKAAVLGKFGLAADDAMMVAVSADEMVRRCAARIAAPVLHHVQWDDEIFSLSGQLELFDLFSSPDKTLRARPGPHHQTRADDLTAWHDHLARHLRPSS